MANLEDSILSVDEKAQIAAQREKQWAAELFGHRLNREAALALGEVDPSTDAAIATLEAALVALAPQKALLREAQAHAASPPQPARALVK